MFFNLEFSIELQGFSQIVLNFKNYAVSYTHLTLPTTDRV